MRQRTKSTSSRVVATVVAALVLLLAAVAPAAAIADGTPSHDARVGALGATVPGWLEEPFFACSGTQISSTVFVTAAHCVAWADAFEGVEFVVSFDDDAYDPGDTPMDPFSRPFTAENAYRATGYAYSPGYRLGAGGALDYAVVLFEGTSVETTLPGPYATLPDAGQLDSMRAGEELSGYVFDRVGYGAASQFGQGAPQILWGDGSRQETTMPYAALTSITLLTQGNVEKTGLGGTCFGDSGSPVLGGSGSRYENTIFAVASWGDAKCRAIDHALRLDTPEAQQFLRQYGPAT